MRMRKGDQARDTKDGTGNKKDVAGDESGVTVGEHRREGGTLSRMNTPFMP